MKHRNSLGSSITDSISRRDFLKVSGVSFLSLGLAPFKKIFLTPTETVQQGRTIYDIVTVYDKPSFSGDVIRQIWADAVFPVVEVLLGDEEPAHNRVWYRLSDEEYVHSGGVQPVQTVLNPPVYNIPPEGKLAEVTVPYLDAYYKADTRGEPAYRFYYETTHWIIEMQLDSYAVPWYRITDDKWEQEFFVPARYLRVVPEDELSPLSPNVPMEAKRIEVDTTQQLVTAYEYDEPVFMTKAATGAEYSTGKFFTPSGRHYTNHKMPSRHMAAGNLARNGFDLPGIPWVSYITESGVAFHGTYWHNDYGMPRSHGCINLPSQASKWIYRWTLPIAPVNERRVYEKIATRVDVI